ncbi:hypothetical protein [Mesorhizobium sp. SP-1A]|uniref:hypothetical protein n=1 Tax=Mesorhizobium sp. SP-1A TaxID=3077840 RepID=UPI0028F72E41|nr:hypothetical protein [Mesorhizobium sp. SP-1A]
MLSSKLDLQRRGNLTETGADVSRMVFGQIEIRKAIRKLRVVQLHTVGRVHGRQDGCQKLAQICVQAAYGSTAGALRPCFTG